MARPGVKPKDFLIDDEAFEQLADDLEKFSNPKDRKKIVNAGISGLGKPISREMKRAIAQTGSIRYGHMKARVGIKHKVYQNGTFWAMAGAKSAYFDDPIRTNKINPAKYVHLVDGGVAAHHNAGGGFTVKTAIGRWRITEADRLGYSRGHPGFAGRGFRAIAERRGVPEARERFLRDYKNKEEKLWNELHGVKTS